MIILTTGLLKNFILLLSLLFCINYSSFAQDVVSTTKTTEGWYLMVDGEPLIVNGINWDYYPVGTNYEYDLWEQSPDFIKQALDHEMGFLQDAGINAIRVYAGIPKEWITYIYKNFGIYTMLNHTFGRYGMEVEGEWIPNTDYGDERVKKLLLDEVRALVGEFKDTEGLLLYLLGNENNYGLFWEGAETEDIPIDEWRSAKRARPMYELFNEAILEIKAVDKNRPVAFCNGDDLFLDQIAEEVPDADIFGVNAYRGSSFTDLFEHIAAEYDKPVLLTEFGADAFNEIKKEEDQKSQAECVLANWKEVYANAAGMGGQGNLIGGFTFQFSDGWWKYGQTWNLDIHDTHASWSNGGYAFDYTEGVNNMNEEWFGVMGKGITKEDGTMPLYPRAAYYVLKEIHRFNPYADSVTAADLNTHFNSISIEVAAEQAASFTSSNQ